MIIERKVLDWLNVNVLEALCLPVIGSGCRIISFNFYVAVVD